MSAEWPTPEYKWSALLALFYDLLMTALFLIAILQWIVNDGHDAFYWDYRVNNDIIVNIIIGACAILVVRVPRSIITINMWKQGCTPERRRGLIIWRFLSSFIVICL
jgi:hypothetical protein